MRFTQENQKHMQIAIDEAKLDPRIHRVGTVIVKGEEVLAKAHGVEEGGQHAEFRAIAMCQEQGKDLKGATLYTTLEPCIHVRSQRKADCAVRVVENGIAEVVVGMLDPDERVCSRGCSYLQQNGVRVRRFPALLHEKIEELNIDFIEAMTVGTDTRRVKRLLTFTNSGKRRPVLGFADNLTPDLPDIKRLIELYGKRPVVPCILWPPANNALWQNALKERQRILEKVRIGALPGRSTELRNKDFEWISALIQFAWKARTRAAARIPNMWRGMADLWQRHRPRDFENALENFLIVCNTNVLLSLARSERRTRGAIFPPARTWIEMVAHMRMSLSGVYQQVFRHPAPFYQVTVRKLGNWHPHPDIEVYIPKPIVIDAWASQEGRRVDWVDSRYMVPQVEYKLIGEKIIVNYGMWEWRRTLNDRCEEISELSLQPFPPIP